MSTVRIQFVLGFGVSSAVIALVGASHFSHCDCVLKSGELLGSRSDVVGHTEPGVQVRPAFYVPWKDRAVLSLKVTPSQEKKFLEFLHSQIGRPYDSTAIWGFAAGRDWRSPDSWFCSELQMAALEAAGIVPALYTPVNKIYPSTLCTVLSALGANAEDFGA